MAAINFLIHQRERTPIKFVVWPFEPLRPDGHVLVEVYPAIFPTCEYPAGCKGNDERDAWKVLQHLVHANTSGQISSWFDVPDLAFGRVDRVSSRDQIQFEGFIFGLRRGH